MHYDRGRGACSNTLLIARRTLENQLLAGLQEKVLHPDVIAYALGAFEEQSLLATKRRGEKSTLQQRRVEVIRRQIRNCMDAIAEGKRHPSLMEKLSELEQELAEVNAKVTLNEPFGVRSRLTDARRYAEARIKQLQLLLTGETRLARPEIAKHVQKITLTPEGRTYVASGNWDVLGAWQHGWCRGLELHPRSCTTYHSNSGLGLQRKCTQTRGFSRQTSREVRHGSEWSLDCHSGTG